MCPKQQDIGGERKIVVNHNLSPKNIIFASVAFGLVSILFVQFLSLVLTPQEAYAPMGRRGYFCEFRPEAQLAKAYDVQAEIMAMTIMQNNGVGMLYLHQ